MLILAACNLHSQLSSDIYYWGDYVEGINAYADQKFELQKEINRLEKIINNAAQKNKQVPPGLKAHLAALYLHAGNNEQAKNLLIEEKTSFPAGSTFVNFQLKNLVPNQLPAPSLQKDWPASILILPPLNNTVEISAQAAILAHSVKPLSENGYYVIPIANMLETFNANGIHSAEEAHEISLAKLYEIFGVDAVLYLTIDNFGANYKVLHSEVAVGVKAEMVSVYNGARLWENSVRRVQTNDNSSNGFVGMLLGAAIDQIGNSLTDAAYDLAAPSMRSLFNEQQILRAAHSKNENKNRKNKVYLKHCSNYGKTVVFIEVF